MADTGTGTTIAFGTSSWTAQVTGIDHDGMSREALDTTTLATTVARTFIPTDLLDNGEVSLEFFFDPDSTPPIDAPPETITITFPLPGGQTTAANYQFTGFLTDWSYGTPLEDLMTGTGTLKVSGAITKTASA